MSLNWIKFGSTRALKWLLAAAVVIGCHGTAVLNGTQSVDGFAFTVASVKRSNPRSAEREGGHFWILPGGRLDASRLSLKALIARAYEVDARRIEAGPDWIDDDRFDIVATFARHAETQAHVPAMLRRLLSERFALQVRHEKRDQQYYALVRTRPGGNLGDGVTASTTDCSAYRVELQRLLASGPLSAPPSGPHCGLRVRFVGAMELHLGGETLSGLAQALQPFVGRLVQDETGLPGRFDFRFTFAPDRSQFPQLGGFGSPPAGTPSIFAAIQEELGLRLESRRGPLDVLVVVRAERPTAG